MALIIMNVELEISKNVQLLRDSDHGMWSKGRLKFSKLSVFSGLEPIMFRRLDVVT